MSLAIRKLLLPAMQITIRATTPPTPINDAHPGGGYFFSGWQHLKYLKPPLSIEKQIELLQQRGMDISHP